MVRTPPTALAGKAGLYKRGMTWNLWWLGHSASAWTSCWGTQAGFPILWYGWAGQFPAWKSGCGGFFPRRRGENGPQVLCLRSCCRQGLWHLPFLYCGLLGRFILGFASFWRFSGGGRRWLYGDWGRKVAGFIGRCGRELWSRPSRRWPASWDGTRRGWTGRGSPGRRCGGKLFRWSGGAFVLLFLGRRSLGPLL